MIPESSPFSPGRIAPVGLFVGRRGELEQLVGMVRASWQGRFRIGFVSGERGMGKSSLAAFVRQSGQQDTVGCHVFLGGVRTLEGMLRQVFNRLFEESIDTQWHESVRSFFGDRVRAREIGFGRLPAPLELALEDRDLSLVRRNFVPAMRRLLQQIEAQKKSILLILDDIDGLASSSDFAHWLKNSVDEIATSRQETRLCILVVGPEERRRELVRSHPSLARVFELIDIKQSSDEETAEFYRKSFQAGKARVSAESVNSMVLGAGGLPVLAHEIGDAVWREAKALEIEDQEVFRGMERAAEVIGAMVLGPRVLQAIQSDRYRSILRKITSRHLAGCFQRAGLAECLAAGERKVLDAFLRRMKSLGVLKSEPGVRGGYRFSDLLHALYFRMPHGAGMRQSNS